MTLLRSATKSKLCLSLTTSLTGMTFNAKVSRIVTATLRLDPLFRVNNSVLLSKLL